MTTATLKNKKFKNKTAVYFSEEGKMMEFVFEAGAYRFDLIEATLNMYKGVKKEVIYSRAFYGKTKQVIKAVEQMKKNLDKVDVEKTNINKQIMKDIKKLQSDLDECIVAFG